MVTYSDTWDLTSFYEGGTSDSAAFHAHIAQIPELIEDLTKTIDTVVEAPSVQTIADGIEAMTTLMVNMRKIGVMLSCLTAQDTTDEEAKTIYGNMAPLYAQMSQQIYRFDKVIETLNDETFAQYVQSPELEQFAFILEETRAQTKLLLSEQEEGIISSLRASGDQAWSQMYDLLIADMKFEVIIDEKVQRLSFGQASNLRNHPDEAVRAQVDKVIEKAFKEKEQFFAHTLNHLAGYRLTTYKKRGWEDVLDEPLRINRMQRETLDAMWQAISETRAPFVDFLNRKAQLLGKEKMTWADLEAPIADTTEHIDFQQGAEFILKHFAKFGPQLESFAREAFEKSWIEAADRPNKRPGGFCTTSPMDQESRIFMTYAGTMNNVSTLAHELGHAFHSYALREVHPMNASYAMNVAETASTFAEMIIADAAVEEATGAEKLALLEDKVQRSVSLFMNIQSRFLFETRFYEARKKGIVPADQLNALMEEAQKEAYGNALATTHPHFWASKLHFYITGVPFYNFPYTFGYLFSLSIYAKAKQVGPAFEEQYIALLRDTGKMTVEDLVMKHLGEDITKQDFWQKGVDLAAKDAELFLQLTK
jgi:oligoendopeptidase F